MQNQNTWQKLVNEHREAKRKKLEWIEDLKNGIKEDEDEIKQLEKIKDELTVELEKLDEKLDILDEQVEIMYKKAEQAENAELEEKLHDNAYNFEREVIYPLADKFEDIEQQLKKIEDEIISKNFNIDDAQSKIRRTEEYMERERREAEYINNLEFGVEYINF